jgi:hypothetical protein
MFRIFSAILVFTFVFSVQSVAQTAEFRNAVRDLAEKSGILSSLTEGGVEAVIDSLKEVYPEVESEYWLKKSGELEKSAKDEVAEYLVVSYAEHFSVEEINALIEFYETPEGRKWASLMPVLVMSHKEAGERWIDSMYSRTITDLTRKGY